MSENEGIYMSTLAVIPARGGSKGIPRKNLRPLAGKPLIFYAIDTCLKAKCIDQVVVSTDDEEIALFAERFGAKVIMRPDDLANDAATLDPVIVHAVEYIESREKKHFDFIVTVQPTSPLVKTEDIDSAIKHFEDSSVDTVLSVVEDKHLCWGIENGRAISKYSKRLNRQQLPENFKETGAIIACKRSQLDQGTRIGSKVALHIMPHERSFDVDSFSDLYLCEAMLTRRRIVFTAVGRLDLGMGHAYRTALLAHELVQHEIDFVCEVQDKLAYEYIKGLNYRVHLVENGKLLSKVLDLQPDLVINDILDTTVDYVAELKAKGIRVVNFEDIGSGSEEADLVVNALYPHRVPSDRHLIGANYFCLRDEFLHLPEVTKSDTVRRVLLTFGGTDENNLSVKVLEGILPECEKADVEIDVVVGSGFRHHKDLHDVIQASEYKKINYVPCTNRISDFMINADIAITSGGRTVYELVALKVPTIVICQNERETTHSFASSEHGVINLGLCHRVEKKDIFDAFSTVLKNKKLRKTMKDKMMAVDLGAGKARVIAEIIKLFQEYDCE